MQDEKFEYFMERTQQDFDEMKREFREVNEKLDKLWSFKAWLYGAAAAVSALVSLLVTFLQHYKG